MANKAFSLDDLCLHHDDVAQAECSAEAAAKLLELAAGYLERREVMPPALADFIATAFRTTASIEEKDHDMRPAKLAQLLNLTAPNRRPKHTAASISLGLQIHAFDALAYGISDTKTIAIIAKRWGIGPVGFRQWLPTGEMPPCAALPPPYRHVQSSQVLYG